VVNDPSILFKEQKTQCDSVPPMCGNIGQTFTHRGVPIVNVLSKHRAYLLLDWAAD
jgi:hypothetical protein